MVNINKLKKYHFIYKTTNLLNNKYYIGLHSTSNLNDGYLGSGTLLKYSIKKYGAENFKCEILEYVSNRIELINREREIVTLELLNDPLCVNLTTGGFTFTGDCRKKSTATLKNRLKTEPALLKKYQESGASKFREWNSRRDYSLPGTFTGRSHSSETIQLMKFKRIGKGLGIHNSQYGTMWITDGINETKIKRNQPIPVGWFKGRK